MSRYISKSILLLALAVVICCVIFPVALWTIGQTIFPFQANGSLLKGPDGAVIGSKLVAQPFSKDEYFQPRPSTPSFDASASASSALAPSNYALRDRVARTLGPLVTYKSGPKIGKPVTPDVEQWFQRDTFQGKPQVVAQWADQHNSLAQAWVSGDPAHAAYVDSWAKTHQAVVAQFIRDNPSTPQPKAVDLAVAFFKDFSKEHPGRFPARVTRKGHDGKYQTAVEPVKEGSDIQSIFFAMWRDDHPDADLQDVPGDMVTSSGSGLDPHITLQSAEFQLDRVASKWASNLKRNPSELRKEIEEVLQNNASAPLGGLAGEKLVNVLEVNLELLKRYGAPQS